ncbi:FAS1 domain-containing protein precursor [Ophiocordyceps camponoti-floridani]|uniref:FAS1 domain-containing protein n=1 Tax=Ophiocordyceps camponoti-floridani TaxID=2030778 RepID=A0A8H4QAF9_9HYPO|nr:FAS1 domain-containing protein precursor [Ophiocordyceps camponoti-floridani]
MPPPTDSAGPDAGPDAGPNPSAAPLADLLNTNRSLTTFSSLTRQQAATSSLLASETLTVLAPLNSALDALPRKPWEDEADYDQFGSAAYDGDDGRCRAERNSSRFVDAHVVPVSPWPKETRVRSRAGRELWWEFGPDGSTRYLMPDRVQVDRVAARASNGELWILKGFLNTTS